MPTTPHHADRILDDVFLTPRVLDETALTHWADSLRDIIRDADDRSTRLASTSADTDKLVRTIREAAKALQARTDDGAKLLSALDTRSKQAKDLLSRLANAISDDKELEKLARSIIDHRRDALEARLTAAVHKLAGPVTEAEQRAARAEARAHAAEQRAAEAEKRLNALETRFNGLVDAADRAADQCAEHEARIASATTTAVSRIQAAAAVSLDTAERDAESIRRRAADAIAKTGIDADRATSNALEAIEQLRVFADHTDQRLAERLAEIERTAAPIHQLADRVQAMLGSPEGVATLDDRVARAEHAARHLDTALPGIEDQLTRLDAVRAALADTLESAAEDLQTLANRRNEICAGLEQEIEAIGSDLSPIQHAAAGLRVQLDAFEARITELTARLQDGPDQRATDAAQPALDTLRANAEEITAAALQRVEEAGMWLVALIQRAEHTAATKPAPEPTVTDQADPTRPRAKPLRKKKPARPPAADPTDSDPADSTPPATTPPARPSKPFRRTDLPTQDA